MDKKSKFLKIFENRKKSQKCPPKMAHRRKYIILAIFLHSMQPKWNQGTLRRQRLTLIESRTRLGCSMDPAIALQYTQHGPIYIGYIFAFYTTKMGSRDSGDTKVNRHWV